MTASSAPGPILKVDRVSVHYGGIEALREVSFAIDRGEIVCLIGANGAGKSTILKAISKLVDYTGDVHFGGQSINPLPAHAVVEMGIVHVPEGRRIFSRLSVAENLRLGAYTRTSRSEREESLRSVFKLFPRLRERASQAGGTLSGGEQQMLAIGRGLMAAPDLLLLDEPSMGIAPILVKEIFTKIAEINSAGTTILLVEQNANAAFAVADRGYVLQNGRVVKKGPAATLRSDPEIANAYLGSG